MDVILIMGDDEFILCSFAQMLGDLEHREVLEVPMPSDVLERVASGEVNQIVFCPAAMALPSKDAPGRRTAVSKETRKPTVFLRGE